MDSEEKVEVFLSQTIEVNFIQFQQECLFSCTVSGFPGVAFCK